MDRRLQFLRADLTDDGYSSVETWADYGSPVWAEKIEISDGERWRAGAVDASVTTRFRIRWSSFSAELTPKDRLSCEGRVFNITGIKELGRREGLEITAAARADA